MIYRSIFTGPEPELEEIASRSDEVDAVIARVEGLPAEKPDLSAAILVRTNRLADQVMELLARRDVTTVRLVDNKADRPDEPGVRVATMHRAKGLEFEAVFLVGVEAGVIPRLRPWLPPSILPVTVRPSSGSDHCSTSRRRVRSGSFA